MTTSETAAALGAAGPSEWRGAKKFIPLPEDLESIDTLAPRMRAHKFPVIGLMLLDSNNSDGRSSLCTKIGFRFVLRLHKTGLPGS